MTARALAIVAAEWRSPKGRAALALVVAAAGLTVLEYWYMPFVVQARLSGRHGLPISMQAGVIWAVASIAFYILVPLVIVLLVHREALSSIGYGLRGLIRHAPLYLGLYALTIPALWIASRRPEFAATYPFVREAIQSRGAFIQWECAYLLQFFALEAFFRGYLLFTLERAMGWVAVFVAAVPYCMVHWHKPPLEAFAAIAGGIVLGALALRYRSFYGGFVVHVLIALTMDVMSASRAGLF